MNKVNKRRKNTSIKKVNKTTRKARSQTNTTKTYKPTVIKADNIKAFYSSRCQLLERFIEGLILLQGGLIEGDLSMRRPRIPFNFLHILRIIRPEFLHYILSYWIKNPLTIDVNGIPIKQPSRDEITVEVFGIYNLVNNWKLIEWSQTQPGFSYLNLMESHIVCLRTNGKRDIIAELKHPLYPDQRIVAFSEKTFVFGNPTLVRGAKFTRFRFKIIGPKEVIEKIRSLIHKINNLKDGDKNLVKERIIWLKELGATLQFHSADYEKLEKRLNLTDMSLIKILAYMLDLYYSGKFTKTYDLLNQTILDNPLSFSKLDGYKNKLADFLLFQTLGNETNEYIDIGEQKQYYEQTKQQNNQCNPIPIKVIGLITLNDDYKIFTYNMYDPDHLIEFLLTNTKFDTPSSQQIDYANILDIDDELYIDLCLHVRFDKPPKLNESSYENEQIRQFKYWPFSYKINNKNLWNYPYKILE